MSHTPFVDALHSLAARMPRVVREREILRVAASLGGGDGQHSAAAARQEVLKWVEKRTGGHLPADAWNHDGFEHRAGGRNCTAVRIADEIMDIWAIRADDPDKNVAQRIWTTEVTVGHRTDQRAMFGVRLLVSSPEQELPKEPAVPGLVQQVAAQCGLDCGGVAELVAEPWLVESDDDAERLIDMLLVPEREMPTFVLTVPEDATDPVTPLLDPGPLARATLGLAKVVVLPARFTWALTDRFGKRLSVFHGAIRVYLPGFTEDANPYGGHELVLADRLATPENASGVGARLRQVAANESLRRLRLGRDVLSFSAVREQSLDLDRSRLEREGATETQKLAAAQAQIGNLKEDLNKALDEQQWLSDEHGVAEDRARLAEAKLTTTVYQIQLLTNQLKERGESPDSNLSLPARWECFADWCDKYLVGRVLLSSRARRETKAPLFSDVSIAGKCLLWLANEYREQRRDGGDGDLRITIENGIRNERCGADSFKFKWQDVHRDVDWHIKNGGNTRVRDRCLRIYYFWDNASGQVVIASMPGHIRTGAT